MKADPKHAGRDSITTQKKKEGKAAHPQGRGTKLHHPEEEAEESTTRKRRGISSTTQKNEETQHAPRNEGTGNHQFTFTCLTLHNISNLIQFDLV